MKSKQEKKARSSAFQKFLKRVEDLGSAWESGNQNIKQVRKRYDEALNELETQAGSIADQARKALKIKKKETASDTKKAKTGGKKKAAATDKPKVKAKKATDKKDKKKSMAKAKTKTEKPTKNKKGGKDKKAKKTTGKKAAASGSNKSSGTKKDKKKKSSDWGNGVAAVPTARKKVAADFAAETRAKRSKAPAKKDDLRLVTGIGAAIETKLNEAGIYTLQHLANASVPRLQNILNEAGAYYRRFDPKSWPNQARRLENSDGGRLN